MFKLVQQAYDQIIKEREQGYSSGSYGGYGSYGSSGYGSSGYGSQNTGRYGSYEGRPAATEEGRIRAMHMRDPFSWFGGSGGFGRAMAVTATISRPVKRAEMMSIPIT